MTGERCLRGREDEPSKIFLFTVKSLSNGAFPTMSFFSLFKIIFKTSSKERNKYIYIYIYIYIIIKIKFLL